MMATEKRTTKKGNSYWANTGAYQQEKDELYSYLVPMSGHCETVNGELIRCSSRLFYEYCNNGNMNAIDQKEEGDPYVYDVCCSECGGNGQDEDEETCIYCNGSGEIQEEEPHYVSYVDSFFEQMARQIEEFVSDAPLDEWREFIKHGPGYSEYKFDDDEMDLYNRIMDEVMHYVLNNEDKPLPEHMKFM